MIPLKRYNPFCPGFKSSIYTYAYRQLHFHEEKTWSQKESFQVLSFNPQIHLQSIKIKSWPKNVAVEREELAAMEITRGGEEELIKMETWKSGFGQSSGLLARNCK